MNNLSKFVLVMATLAVPCLAQRPLHVSHPYHPPAQLKTTHEQAARPQRTEVARNRPPQTQPERQASTGKNRK